MTEESEGQEQVEPERAPERASSGFLTLEQSGALLRSLSRSAKFAVNIIPVSESFGDPSISLAASKAVAEEFALIFRYAGWEARVFDANPHPSSRPLGTVTLVTCPHTSGEMPRRGRKGAQALRRSLEEQGIQSESYNSSKVDPETFELHITIRTQP